MLFLHLLFQFTFTNTEWLESSFQKRECVRIVPSVKDSTRYIPNWYTATVRVIPSFVMFGKTFLTCSTGP